MGPSTPPNARALRQRASYYYKTHRDYETAAEALIAAAKSEINMATTQNSKQYQLGCYVTAIDDYEKATLLLTWSEQGYHREYKKDLET